MGVEGEDSLLDAGGVGGFRGRGDASAHGVKVDVYHTSEDGGQIEEGLGFEAGFPEAALYVIFAISGAGDEFVGVFHEPAEVAEAATELGDAVWGVGKGRDLEVEGRRGCF